MTTTTIKPAPYPIQKLSGFRVGHGASIPSLKDGKFRVVQALIAGDARTTRCPH